MRQLFTRDQMTQNLTHIGHCTAFNNEDYISYLKPDYVNESLS